MSETSSGVFPRTKSLFRLGAPRGAEKRELQDIDGGGGWGTYKNDGKAYADFLGSTLHVWGGGQSERLTLQANTRSCWQPAVPSVARS